MSVLLRPSSYPARSSCSSISHFHSWPRNPPFHPGELSVLAVCALGFLLYSSPPLLHLFLWGIRVGIKRLPASLSTLAIDSRRQHIVQMDFHLVPRGEDRNYTGFLTKTITYTASLIVFLAGMYSPRPSFPYKSERIQYTLTASIPIAAFGLSIASIIVPNWVSYHSEKVHPPARRRIACSRTKHRHSQHTTTPMASTGAVPLSPIHARASRSAQTASQKIGISAPCGAPSAL